MRLDKTFIRGAVTALSMTLIVGLTVHAYANRRAREVVVDSDAVTDDLKALRQEIDAIDSLNAQSSDRGTRKKIARRIGKLRDELAAVALRIDEAPAADRDDDRRDHRTDRTDRRDHRSGANRDAMIDADFQQLVTDLDATAMSSDKLLLVKQAADFSWFTSVQVGQVVDHLSYSDDKVEAAATLYVRVVDPANFTKVYVHFTHSSDKEALRKRIAQ